MAYALPHPQIAGAAVRLCLLLLLLITAFLGGTSEQQPNNAPSNSPNNDPNNTLNNTLSNPPNNAPPGTAKQPCKSFLINTFWISRRPAAANFLPAARLPSPVAAPGAPRLPPLPPNEQGTNEVRIRNE
jgi:hypothetical protein